MPRLRTAHCVKCHEENWRERPNGTRQCRTCSNRNRAERPAKARFRSLRHRAEEKGLEFTIDIDDLEIPDVCPVLGIPIERTRGGPPAENSPSVDRIDNTKGYTKDNVHVISFRANRLKNNATPDELRAVADYIERKAAGLVR